MENEQRFDNPKQHSPTRPKGDPIEYSKRRKHSFERHAAKRFVVSQLRTAFAGAEMQIVLSDARLRLSRDLFRMVKLV